MIVMERLAQLPTHHFDIPIRTAMFKEFRAKLHELHNNLFIHGDLIRPTNRYTRGDGEWMFGNIIQTPTGLRLIDPGFAEIYQKKNINAFVKRIAEEREEIGYFKEYYLGK